MGFYIDENDYPQNYDWLPFEKQEAIICYLDNLCETRMRLCSTVPNDIDDKKLIERRCCEFETHEYICVNFLELLGIKMEKGWVGHGSGYFLATYNDALAQQEYYDDIARDDEGDVDLCYAGRDYNSDIDY